MHACEMADSIDQGSIVEASKLRTISDGTAGGLDPDTITYQYCKQLVDQFIRVEEEEIVAALKMIHDYLGVIVEPAAGLALAGIVKYKKIDQGWHQRCHCLWWEHRSRSIRAPYECNL